MPLIATFVCIAEILWLFALDRDRDAKTSPALWIPTLWLLINGSRSVSQWLHSSAVVPLAAQYSEGSPMDAAIYGLLILGGIVVLNFRTRRTGEILLRNVPILLFFFYCAVSILWSPYPFIALKRWSKAIGDLVMVLVVLTDPDPIYAIKQFLKRVTFILMPVSVLLILFYPALGTAYDPTDNIVMYVGVTTFKNLLGMIVMICGLSSVWSFLCAFEDRQMIRRKKHMLAHGLMILTALGLLVRCNSMTSLSCFGLTSMAMVMATHPWTLRKPGRIHLVTAATVAVPLFALFLDSGLLHILGRKPNLTDRTAIWAAVLAMHTNPFVGTGFESFWLGSHLQSVWDLSVHGIQEAHNGYLETYINLGWFGELLLIGIIVTGYRKILRMLPRMPQLGRLELAYFTAALIYCLTEAGFRMMNPIWITFLLAIASTSIAIQRQRSEQTAVSPLMQKVATGQMRILR